MTDAAAPAGSVRASLTAAQTAMEARLKKRHRAETWFKAQGLMAITIAMIFLVVLVGRIVGQGYTTFQTHTLSVPVYLNPERIDTSDLEGVNYDYIVAEAMMKKLGVVDDDLGLVSGKVMDLTSRDLGFQLLNMLKADKVADLTIQNKNVVESESSHINPYAYIFSSISHEIRVLFDYLGAVKSGEYGVDMKTYDILKQMISQVK